MSSADALLEAAVSSFECEAIVYQFFPEFFSPSHHWISQLCFSVRFYLYLLLSWLSFHDTPCSSHASTD